LALFVYDFLITFGDEVNLFWLPRRLNGPSILFFLNRYLALTVQLYGFTPKPASHEVYFRYSVNAWYTAFAVIASLQIIPWAAFSALRSYALCPSPHRMAISTAVFALFSVPFVVNMIVRTLIHILHYWQPYNRVSIERAT
ncbi:hypothetical protein BD309DRAFT_875354, partial [Dichomitus squalens]